MDGKEKQSGIEGQVGLITGKLDGLIGAVNTLSNRFEEHLRQHWQAWLWVLPTLISLATLAVLIFSLTRG